VAEVKVVKGSGAYNEALITEKPSLMNPRTLLLFLCCLLGFFCQTMNGFDGSLFNGLTANKQFLSFFHGSNNGIWAGIVSAMYQIGGVCALPFVGPCIDTWGRRVGMFIGSFLIIMGTVITGTTIHTASIGQFEGGRFLLGFGVSIASAAGPIYVVETSHPAFRGVVTAYCNTFWFTGSILASGAVRGALNLGGNISWQLPVWLQMLFSGLICLFCFFIPESPRWLYVSGKQDKAIATLTKWHGYGNPESAWVKLQLQEYKEYLIMDGAVSQHEYAYG
jgi:MFS family permease